MKICRERGDLMAKHTIEELYQWQALPLSIKIRMTEERIREWVREYGLDYVYVAFSGGIDSRVLLHIARGLYPGIKGAFVDTGLEYPEIREFVKTFENIDWLKPKKTFREVIFQHGYPFVSKEISDAVSMARRGFQCGIDKLNGVDKNGNPCDFRKGFKKWKFLLDAPFDVSDECCFINKKEPCKRYEKETGRKPMTGSMASESAMRKTSWLRTGCNSFDSDRPMSNPMAFWTQQDVLLYIYERNLPIASVYGRIIEDGWSLDNGVHQLSLSDYGIFDKERPLLKTTGCDRTGCMFCGYGAHCRDDDRFVRMKETHPKQYDYIMRPTEQGGLNYKEIIDWINEHGNLNIRY